MDDVLGIVVLIILIPVMCDMCIPESHICSYILNEIPIYRKAKDFFENNTWLLIPICLLIVFPLCFYLGYSVSKMPNCTLYGGYYLTTEFGHTSSAHVNWVLKNQIHSNDSVFSVKTSNKDSIVFDRINKKFIHKAKPELPTEDYSRYVNKNVFQMFLLGAIVIPTWNEVKSTANFASYSKKAWGVAILVAGYLGFHQGYKCKQTILKNESWNKWLNLQEKLLDENWWMEFSTKYPYYPNEYIIDENSSIGGGIGIGYEIKNNTIVVTNVENGSPAEKSGIIKGDKIITIDGEVPYEILCKDYEELNLDIETSDEYDLRIVVFFMLRGKVNSNTRLGISSKRFNDIHYIDVKRMPLPLHFSHVVNIPEYVIE